MKLLIVSLPLCVYGAAYAIGMDGLNTLPEEDDLKTTVVNLVLQLRTVRLRQNVMRNQFQRLQRRITRRRIVRALGQNSVWADSSLVYSGVAGGEYHSVTGSGASYQCLPLRPQWNKYTSRHYGHANMYGVEYRDHNRPLFKKTNAAKTHDHDVPCAVCLAERRSAKIMIPGLRNCTTGWTKEYEGYLMTGYRGHKASYDYACVDEAPEVRQGGARQDHKGALMYPVEAVCGTLPCPNYVNYRELTCAVCTK